MELTRGCKSSLLRVAAGYGKTKMIYMFKYYFDILYKAEFEDVFQYTEAIHCDTWEPSTPRVLELDFGGLEVAVNNEGLRRFAENYGLLESTGKKWEELKSPVAADALNSIMVGRFITRLPFDADLD